MKIGKVVGNIVATRKDERLVGQKLLVVQVLQPDENGDLVPVQGKDSYVVSIDLVGAGVGEQVIYCTGSSARRASGKEGAPIDGAIVGIIDTVDIY